MQTKIAALAMIKLFNTLIKLIYLIVFMYKIQLMHNIHIDKKSDCLLKNFLKSTVNKYPPQCKKVHMIYRGDENT